MTHASVILVKPSNTWVLLQQTDQGLGLPGARNRLDGQQIHPLVDERLEPGLVPLQDGLYGHDVSVGAARVLGAVVEERSVRADGAGDEGLRVADARRRLGLVGLDGPLGQVDRGLDELQALLLGLAEVLDEAGHRGLVGVGLDHLGAGAEEVEVRAEHRLGVGAEEPARPEGVAVDPVAHVGDQLGREAAVQHLHVRRHAVADALCRCVYSDAEKPAAGG